MPSFRVHFHLFFDLVTCMLNKQPQNMGGLIQEWHTTALLQRNNIYNNSSAQKNQSPEPHNQDIKCHSYQTINCLLFTTTPCNRNCHVMQVLLNPFPAVKIGDLCGKRLQSLRQGNNLCTLSNWASTRWLVFNSSSVWSVSSRSSSSSSFKGGSEPSESVRSAFPGGLGVPSLASCGSVKSQQIVHSQCHNSIHADNT